MQADMEVVGEAANGFDAVAGVQNAEPDVVLMDLTMPGGGGLAAIVTLKEGGAKTRFVVLTVHDEPGYLRAAGQAGADGYVLKSTVDTKLLAAIREVAQGRTSIDAHLASEFDQSSMRSTRDETKGLGTAALTERELDVMQRVAEGFTNAQIAGELGLDVKAVDSSRSRIMEKLGLTSRSALVRFARDCGILVRGGRDA